MALWLAVCDPVHIPQGLRKLTLVEVASGHDMTVSDLPSLLDEQSSAQESLGLSRGERSTSH